MLMKFWDLSCGLVHQTLFSHFFSQDKYQIVRSNNPWYIKRRWVYTMGSFAVTKAVRWFIDPNFDHLYHNLTYFWVIDLPTILRMTWRWYLSICLKLECKPHILALTHSDWDLFIFLTHIHFQDSRDGDITSEASYSPSSPLFPLLILFQVSSMT